MGNPQQNFTLLPSLQVYCHLNYDSKARFIQHWKIVVVVEPTIETEITWILEPPAVDDYNLSTNQQLIKLYKLITGKWGKHLNCYQDKHTKRSAPDNYVVVPSTRSQLRAQGISAPD